MGDKYGSAAKALYEFNAQQTGNSIPWLEAKIAVRIVYWKRAKICIEAYERELKQ